MPSVHRQVCLVDGSLVDRVRRRLVDQFAVVGQMNLKTF